jgi:hypothetical protein
MARKQMSKQMSDDLDLGFEISSIKKSSNVFKAGDYRFVVETMKIEMNGTDTIKNLNVRLCFVGGEYDGKKLFARHPVGTTRTDEGMKTAVGMGLDRVKELGTACGVSGSNLAPCIGQEVIGRIAISPAKGNFDESNDVKKYLPAPKLAATVKPAAGAGAGSFLAKKKAAEALAKAQADAAAFDQTDPATPADDDGLPF